MELILLAELYSAKLLLQYETIIIDETHKRSLSINFFLGSFFEKIII